MNSKQQTMNSKQQTKSVMPTKKYSVFCKICFDAGKTENEFTNHFVKDKQGCVVCPTLLSLNCRYCKQNGHTVSYCSLLKNNETRKANEAKQQMKESTKDNSTKENSTKEIASTIGFKRKNIDKPSSAFDTNSCDLFPPLSCKLSDLHVPKLSKERIGNDISYAEKVKSNFDLIESPSLSLKKSIMSLKKQDAVVSSFVEKINFKKSMIKPFCWTDEVSSIDDEEEKDDISVCSEWDEWDEYYAVSKLNCNEEEELY